MAAPNTASNRFQTHPQPRLPYIMSAPGIDTAEDRSANALEHIAMYLDRMETHMDRIAGCLESGGFNEKLRLELSSITQMLPTLLGKR
ncbi:MAG TPA: hypothetical protein VFR09_06380 [Alphaproteobacteria bacterium]|nr:hypothetical protein [Alphaproteobacteria bacterium]